MKKHLFLGFLGAMALASCSNDEPINNSGADNGSGDTAGEAQYLAINIVSTPATAPVPASKAAEDLHPGEQHPGEPGDATYEEGYASENAVSSARFYFFDAQGNALDISGTETPRNYYDWTPTDAGQDLPNVEKQLAATIVIHKGKVEDDDKNNNHPHPNGQLPSQMIAILNPQVTSLGTDMKSIDDLRAIEEDYVKLATGSNGAFVMANSVYKGNGAKEIVATSISEANYQTTAELAKNYPINIYVERNVAKVRVKFDHSDKSKITYIEIGGTNVGKYQAALLKDKDGNPIKVMVKNEDGTEVETQAYIRFYGWNVTGETNVTRLSKKIDTSWAEDLFGAEQWNWSPYFRSYWAINATAAKQSWHTFNDIMKGGKNFEGDLANSIYINENAPQQAANANSATANIEKFTKVIMKGQLIDAKGNPLEVCKYAGLTLVGQENLKTAILGQLQQNGMIYKHWEDANGTKHVESLDKDMVVFKTAIATDGGYDNSDLDTEKETGRYYVYMQLAANQEANDTYIWNTSNDAESLTPDSKLTSVEAINTYLRNQLGSAQVYAEGNTYYYFPLQHFGATDHIGYYGVVRNHIYDCSIDDIRGLGTPVFNPEENIWPEKPKEEDTFIGAQINILSWRVVPNHVTLDW